MNFSEICIRRPVLTMVMSLLLVVVGLLAFKQLSLRAEPKVFRPRITISVRSPGGSVEYMETAILTPLEHALLNVPAVSYMESEASLGYVDITLHFKNMSESAFVITQSQVAQAVPLAQLPDGVDAPVVRAGGREGNQLMMLALSAPNMSAEELTDYAHNHFKQVLQQQPGVSTVLAFGDENALHVDLDPIKMTLLHVTIDDVVSVLKANRLQTQVGQLINQQQAITLNVASVPQNLSTLGDLVIKHQANSDILLRDVAMINVSARTRTGSFVLTNGEPGAGFAIYAADGANPIATGQKLRALIDRLRLTMPVGMQIHVVWDQTKILTQSVNELFHTLIHAVLLVALITILFLGNVRFAVIPIVTVPICMLFGFVVMWGCQFSINMMTLLALVLAVGLVVDDAIVVLENCHRYIEQGYSSLQAAIASMEEVMFPVVGMTISLAAVYFPMVFLQGKTAVYFQQFAFTLAGTVLVSGFVALTLTPMMCARLSAATAPSRYLVWLNQRFGWLMQWYRRGLAWLLVRRWLPISVFAACLVGGYFTFATLPSALQPTDYAGIVYMGVKGPDSASNYYMKQQASPIIAAVRQMPEVDVIMSFIRGGSVVGNIIHLKPAYSSKEKTPLVAANIMSRFHSLHDVAVFASPININRAGGGGENSDPNAYSFFLQGYVDAMTLSRATKAFGKALMQSHLFTRVDNSLRFNSQAYDLIVDRAMAMTLGVSQVDINTALATYLGGYVIENGYRFGGLMYPVIVQLSPDDLVDFHVLDRIYVNNVQGQSIALSRLVQVKPVSGLSERTHINAVPAASMYVTAKPGLPSGDVLQTLYRVAERHLPKGVSIGFSQHFLDMKHGNQTMVMVFVLGVVFIYLTLAALFESFIDPLIILLTVPVSVVGAGVALYGIGGTLDMYSGIALVTLVGLVAKHGVLITHFANEYRRQGMPLMEAVLQAAVTRLRPILMTTAMMMIGALPLVLSQAVGSASRIEVGTVIIAGLFVGTLFSLVIVPVAYLMLARFHRIEPVER